MAKNLIKNKTITISTKLEIIIKQKNATKYYYSNT